MGLPSYNYLVEKFTMVMHTTKNTGDSYKNCLKDFGSFLEKNKLTYSEARPSDVKMYQNFLNKKVEQGVYKEGTVYQRLSCLKSFYKFISNDYPNELRDITQGLKNPKPDNSHDIYLTYEEVKYLIKFLKNMERKNGQRQFELLKARDLFYFTLELKNGFRVGEIITLTKDSFDLDKDIITIPKHLRKNKTALINPLDEESKKLYTEYIKLREAKGGNQDEEIFVSVSGKKLGRSDINAMISKRIQQANNYYEELGYGENFISKGKTISSHKLRHTTSYLLGRQNLTQSEIGKVLGQKSLTVTARYSHANIEEIREKQFNLL